MRASAKAVAAYAFIGAWVRYPHRPVALWPAAPFHLIPTLPPWFSFVGYDFVLSLSSSGRSGKVGYEHEQ